MRVALWILLIAVVFFASVYEPFCIYFLVALIIFPIFSAAFNAVDSSIIDGKADKITARKNENFVISLKIFGNGCKIKGEIVCENILTHEKISSLYCGLVERDGTEISLELCGKSCGKIKIEMIGLLRYDICGLTYKKMKPISIGEAVIMPNGDMDIPNEITDIIDAYKIADKSGEYEVSNSREYVQGDELRHVNHKLTHRFEKLYIKEYSHTGDSKIGLMFDMRYNKNPKSYDELVEKFVALCRYLTECRLPFYAITGNEKLIVTDVKKENIDTILMQILCSETVFVNTDMQVHYENIPENVKLLIIFSERKLEPSIIQGREKLQVSIGKFEEN